MTSIRSFISALSKSCYSHIRQLCCIRPYLDHKTASTIATSIVHSKLDYCNSLYHKLPNTQLNVSTRACFHVCEWMNEWWWWWWWNRPHQIQNSLVSAVARAPTSSHINLFSNIYTGIKLSIAQTTRFFLSHTKSSPPLNLHIYSHLIPHISVYHFLHHHRYHPSLILSSTPGLNSSLPQNLSSILQFFYLHSPDWLDISCFSFSRAYVGFNSGTVVQAKLASSRLFSAH